MELKHKSLTYPRLSSDYCFFLSDNKKGNENALFGIFDTIGHTPFRTLKKTIDQFLKQSRKIIKQSDSTSIIDVAKLINEVSDTRNAQSTAVNEEAKAAVIAAGSEGRQLTPEQRASWVAAMKPVWSQFEGDVGADTIAAAQAANLTN